MKLYALSKLRLSLLSSLCLCALPLTAQEKPASSEEPNNETQEIITGLPVIHIYSEIIEISSIQYADLMTDPMTSTNQTALRNKLIEQISKGEAKLISNQSALCRSGQRLTSESIKEIIYETEYEPGENIPTKNKEGKKSFDMILPPTPTAFDTRNVGTILEVVPIISDNGETIDTLFKKESIKHTGYNVMATWDTELAKVNVQMPNFYTMRISTSFSIYNNQFTLIGTYAPELNGVTDESRKLLHFVRASIMRASK